MTRINHTKTILIKLFLIICFFVGCSCYASKKEDLEKTVPKDFQLIWEDNFDTDGYPDPRNWSFEYGFVRNRELQWYKPQNAYCVNGHLTIEGKRENTYNPNYNPLSDDWRTNRSRAEYSSACLITKDLQEWFPFGYFEIRAKINVSNGAWPAIWMLGTKQNWPYCGEIDIMEFYRINNVPHILANAAWGSEIKYQPHWDDAKIPLKHFTQADPDWAEKFHTWSMHWDEEQISIYIDDELLNQVDLKQTINPDGGNPFTSDQKFYLLLNLAIGGNGGDPALTEFPIRFQVDYVRVYKATTETN
ncbi:glycoside hydrolase family 16 protein [Draconibacterium halophilum]|uniref:Glycoside hydrolase family 16 protein n=1 Tax=Draconibacterium halophilum TaxID=2706887 RepID=A0A6C0RAK2_9BACT|nr:glycoside hydrolase family 16 protein [Draconibacterium halophilum]QIA07648.1 glycoside hydrolase family 16 protein [Draconibacterium halophilum]